MAGPYTVHDWPVDTRLFAFRRRQNAELRRVHPDIVWRILAVGKLEVGPKRPSGHNAVRAGHLQDDGLKSRQFHLSVKLHAFLDTGPLPQHSAVRSDNTECRRLSHLVAAINAADGLKRNGTAAKRNRDTARRFDAKRCPILLAGKAHVSDARPVRPRLAAYIHHRDVIFDAGKSCSECCRYRTR